MFRSALALSSKVPQTKIHIAFQRQNLLFLAMRYGHFEPLLIHIYSSAHVCMQSMRQCISISSLISISSILLPGIVHFPTWGAFARFVHDFCFQARPLDRRATGSYPEGFGLPFQSLDELTARPISIGLRLQHFGPLCRTPDSPLFLKRFNLPQQVNILTTYVLTAISRQSNARL